MMKKRMVCMTGLCMVLLLIFSGCDARNMPSNTVSEQQTLPVSVSTTEPEGFQRQSIIFPDCYTSQWMNDNPRLDGEGILLPPAANGTVWPDEGDLLCAELLLPNGWTLRLPEKGAETYAATLNGPVNIYREDGVCVGTMGYSDFTLEGIERWDGAGFDEEPIKLSLEEEYQPIYWWLMGPWQYDYVSVCQTDRTSAATCRIRYDAQGLGTETDYYNKGILAYDKAVLKFIGIELQSNAVTDEQLKTIAQSVRLSAKEKPDPEPLPAPTTVVPEDFFKKSVMFPAYQGGKADYNAEIYDTNPFLLTMALPEGWTVRKPAQEQEALPFTPMEIYDGETLIGSVGFMTFEIPPDPPKKTAQNYHLMVYNQLMLGSIVNWDNDYTTVTETETTNTATCKVMHKDDSPEWAGRMPDAPEYYSPAIVSCDEKMLVYVAMSFVDGSVTDEQLLTIAQSMQLRTAKCATSF